MKIYKSIVTLAITAVFGCSVSFAEAPAGYYSTAENKTGRDLLSALHNKMGSHTNVGYDGLLTLYKTSDVYPDGKIWDMYSTKHWNYGTTCGNYSVVGDCYNREHSMPKSWFSNASPMNSDAFHIYPTDGKVNGQRSNYPYGECANGTYLPANGSVRPLGKLGTSTFPGYSGRVFEPDDEYKGDFARSYFYMAAAYYDRIGSWHSDMLAGNNFPAFKTWAVNLLLKWHRQDPVSEKEIKRNDVVYGRQRNRNPFIDHPELVEYIWGDKVGQPWTPGGVAEPEFVLPAAGASVDFGTTASGHPVTRTITVRTVNAQGNISVSTGGAGFTASAAYIATSETNTATGKVLTLTFNPTGTGLSSTTLTLACGNLTRTVALSGNSVNGLPAGPARYVTDESFEATWVYVGDDVNGNYTLDVATGGSSIAGYPRAVAANAGVAAVTGLEPSTAYVYTVSSASMTSSPVAVTTGEPVPNVDFLFDGRLYFEATPGEPSEAAELLMETDNISDDVVVSVGAPFELSDNRSDWAPTVTVSPDQGRLYLRMNAQTAGTFTSTLTARSGSYVSEGVTIEGVASVTPDFLEDFEADASAFGTYDPTDEYHGTAARWILTNAGIWSSDPAVSGSQSLRFGKKSDSSLEMAEDRNGGIGTVSFQAKYWSKEADPEIQVQYSTDGGYTYVTAGTVKITSSAYAPYSVFVGVAGKARIRLQQTVGQRLNIDDIAMTRHSSGVDDPEAERHGWDAYCRGGELIVAVSADEAEIAVYSIDGTTVFSGTLGAGEHSMGSLAPGLYIVASGDFGRRVVVR